MALAQAIDGEVKGSDFVTPLILERGLGNLKLQMVELNGALRVELAKLEGDLTTKIERNISQLFFKMIGLGLTATSINIGAVYFLVLHLKR